MKCDRCGKSIIIHKKSQLKMHKFKLNIFKTPNKHKITDVDLCTECEMELWHYRKKADSYFMNNPGDAIDIFDKSKYYRG